MDDDDDDDANDLQCSAAYVVAAAALKQRKCIYINSLCLCLCCEIGSAVDQATAAKACTKHCCQTHVIMTEKLLKK